MIFTKPHIRRSMRLAVIVVFLPYLLVCTIMFFRQETLIFYPDPDPPETRYNFGVPVEEVWLEVEDASLHALWFRREQTQGVIFYLHGNAGSLRSWGAVAPDLLALGYDVFMLDYRSYGQSSGKISNEAQLHADVAMAYTWLLNRYREDEVVVLGRSLGSGFAVRLAAERQPRLLLLETPFYSLETLMRQHFAWAPTFLLKYPLRSHEWIGKVRCPVVIFHGTEDTIVPFANGERLAQEVTAPLRFHVLPGGNHNNLKVFPAYWQGLQDALADEW